MNSTGQPKVKKLNPFSYILIGVEGVRSWKLEYPIIILSPQTMIFLYHICFINPLIHIFILIFNYLSYHAKQSKKK